MATAFGWVKYPLWGIAPELGVSILWSGSFTRMAERCDAV
nr:hypothetical protein [Kibdelosporangium sp. MJ126-NF4]